MAKLKPSKVVFRPYVLESMNRGVKQLTNAIRPTLGPGGRTVAYMTHRDLPEFLGNGGDIARRIVELPRGDEDVGAMLVREMILSQSERAGDGTATTAVLFHKIFEHGVRYITAGGDPDKVRRTFENALPMIWAELERQALPLEGKDQMASSAASICHDPLLADKLGEIFDVIGEYGQLDIRVGHGRELQSEYVDGAHWSGGLFSREMLLEGTGEWVNYEDAAIFLSDFNLDDPRQLLVIFEEALRANFTRLVIVARRLSPQVTALLLANSKARKINSVAVKLPGLTTPEHMAALEDLAVLTGATPFLEAIGAQVKRVRASDFGQVRQVQTSMRHLWLVGGNGDPRKKRLHLERLQARFDQTEDPGIQEELRARIGKFLGGSATLWVGGATKTEMTWRKAEAQRAATTLRAALRGGVVPGGGVALLACCPEVNRYMLVSNDEAECAAYRMLMRALEEPARTILANSGYDFGELTGAYSSAKDGGGFDVVRGEAVNMVQAGILDSLSVLKTALGTAVRTAGLALTTEALVHR